MQVGFTMLETGTVRKKNSQNILIKNLFDSCVGALGFYLIGYGFANAADGGMIGTIHFMNNEFDDSHYLHWVFEYTFCSTAATIVSGSLAERTFLDTYLIYSLLMTTIIFPITSAWVWGGGWLQELGFKDFAGGTAVHLIGGLSGLIGAIILGPRAGKYGYLINNKGVISRDAAKKKKKK